MEPNTGLAACPKCMQVQQVVVRIQLQQLQGLEVLLFQLGVALEETRVAFIVLRGEDELEAYAADFFTRLTWSAADSFT